MAKRFVFTLREDAKPHIYIDTIKKFIEEDGYLHPTMKKLLLLMKKTRMRYIILSRLKEVIIVKTSKNLIDKEYYLLERSLNPLKEYFVNYITNDSIQKLKNNEREYYKELIGFYDKLGYNAIEENEMSEDELQTLKATIKFPKEERV